MSASMQKSAPAIAGRANDKIAPVSFANVEALIASRPNTQGNTQQRTFGEAADAGRAMIITTAASFGCYEAQPLPLDERDELSAMKGRDILLERLIGAIAGNYGYALAYADAATERLKAHMASEEADRDGVAGFASKAERLMEQLMERDAQAAWLCDIITGATEEFLTVTGAPFKLYQPVDRKAEVVRTAEQKAAIASNINSFLANRGR